MQIRKNQINAARTLPLFSSVLMWANLLFISGHVAQAQSTIPLTVRFWYPTNGETFTAPANIGVHAQVADSNVVETVQYFAGTNSIGLVSNKTGVIITNLSADSPFYMLWSNVPAGTYTLTALATDAAGV